MKDVSKLVILILLANTLAVCQAPDLLLGWPYRCETGLGSVVVTPRFAEQDSFALYYNNRNGEIIKFRRDNSYYPNWPFVEPDVPFLHTSILADVDNDSIQEFIVNSSDYLFIVDDTGELLFNSPYYLENTSSVSMADYDSDGEYEFICFSRQQREIYCTDIYGNSQAGWPVTLPEDAWISIDGAGSIGDLDDDGYLEIVIRGFDNIYAYRCNGEMQPGFPIEIIDTVYSYLDWHGPSLADLDNDGKLEIITAACTQVDLPCSSYIAIYCYDGSLMENWPKYYNDNTQIFQVPTVADINNDGLLEIGFTLANENEGGLYFLDIYGDILPGWPSYIVDTTGWPVIFESDIIVVDIDGDNDCEIFGDFNVAFPDSSGHGYYSKLFGLDHLGNLLSGFPIIVEDVSLSTPPSFHLDSNYRMLMGLNSAHYYVEQEIDSVFVEVFQFPDSTGPPDQWPMQGHDNLMTRNYNFVDRVTAIRDDEQPLPKSYILTQNYPNPFNAATTIDFALPKPEHVTITVYDILGRRVEALVDETLPAGNHQALWQADDYASGMYFYRMEAGDLTLSRKMLLIK